MAKIAGMAPHEHLTSIVSLGKEVFWERGSEVAKRSSTKGEGVGPQVWSKGLGNTVSQKPFCQSPVLSQLSPAGAGDNVTPPKAGPLSCNFAVRGFLEWPGGFGHETAKTVPREVPTATADSYVEDRTEIKRGSMQGTRCSMLWGSDYNCGLYPQKLQPLSGKVVFEMNGPT